jgi:pSer/pThr/pTyr-binding forkhead associated (FHA) protein
MTPPFVEIAGSRGVFAGVRVELRLGQRITVGRSRFVELSAVKTPMAVRIGREKLEKNSGFRRMSRRHFEIAYEADNRILISDQSRNGVLLDGRKVEGSAVIDPGTVAEAGAHIRFGAGEELCLLVRKAVGVLP